MMRRPAGHGNNARSRAVFALFAALLCLCAGAFLLVPRALFAQAHEPTLSAHVEPDTVEVGEGFDVVLQATSEANAGSPNDPRIVLPPGMSTGTPSISTQSQVSIINGRMTQRASVTMTWHVVPSREGKFKVGPLSVTFNGTRFDAAALTIAVGPRGSHPHRTQQQGANPFDPFGMFPRFPNFFGNPQTQTPPQEPPPADPEIALDAPLDAMAFLRAVTSKTHAVVGEQVTATVYLYTRRAVELTDLHEPSTKDFLRRDLLSPGSEPDAQPMTIGGVLWYVKPLYKAALFPLRSGDLEISPMQLSILGAGRGTGARGGLDRASAALKVHVSEPPAAGRPNGYQIGDVGRFSLAASVEPRKTDVDAAVAVTVTLTGTGNLPGALRPPMQNGIEWLDPEVRESWDTDSGKVKCSRTYTFLARPKTPGNIDLGAFSLPFWDPERQAYDVAKVALGSIKVGPAATAANTEPLAARDPLAAAGQIRTALAAFRAPLPPWTEHGVFWLGLLGAPLAVVLGTLGTRGARAAGARMRARKESTAAAIDGAFSDARNAEKNGDARSVAAATERALYLAILACTGLRARAILLHELPAALGDAGVDSDLAEEIREFLARTDSIRFGQAPAEGALGKLVRDARTLCEKLEKRTGGAAK